MAWNEPGGNSKDPWGRNDKEKGPPDLDEVFVNLKSQVDKLFGRRGGSSGSAGSGGSGPGISSVGVGIVAAIVVGGWILSGFYIVQAAERGVVTRFGAHKVTTGPGLHWRMPWPIEQVQRVNVDQNNSLQLRSQQVLTQDENIVEVDIAVQFNILNAEDFLFQTRDPSRSMQQVLESAVREVIGRNTMDFILTQGRDTVASETSTQIQDVMNSYRTGYQVTAVNLERAQPPEEVQAAFSDANKAREDEQRYINEAEAYRNEVVPQARGDAARLLEEAKGHRTRVVKSAEGESQRFSDLLVEYRKAPDITRERLYLDAMGTILGNSTKVMMDAGNNNLLYLPIENIGGAGGRNANPNPLPRQVLPSFDSTSSGISQSADGSRARNIRER